MRHPALRRQRPRQRAHIVTRGRQVRAATDPRNPDAPVMAILMTVLPPPQLHPASIGKRDRGRLLESDRPSRGRAAGMSFAGRGENAAAFALCDGSPRIRSGRHAATRVNQLCRERLPACLRGHEEPDRKRNPSLLESKRERVRVDERVCTPKKTTGARAARACAPRRQTVSASRWSLRSQRRRTAVEDAVGPGRNDVV